ncbi:fibroblast growth factor-binding protein 1 [Rhynchocyon petersi]
MRILSLALLSFLLLAAQLLSVESKKERGNKKAPAGGPGRQPRVRAARGRFRTPEQAECRWAEVQEADDRAAVKVECARGEHQFHCFFAGNPHSCPEFATKKKTYWKQIGRTLARQTNICGDLQTVLKTKLCKKVPGAQLKMVNSTLISKEHAAEKSIPTPLKPNLAIETKETVPAETQRPTKGKSDPNCEQDPDIQYQSRLAEQYCGESWGSLCKFFLAMLQDNSCS